MIFDRKGIKQILFSLLVLIFSLAGMSQIDPLEEDYYKAYDNYIGVENTEIYNGASFIQQFRTLDKSHMFFETPEFLKGLIEYKNQPYQAKIKYDIVNDLVVVKYIDSLKSFPLSLNASLVDRFTMAENKFVRLKANKELSFVYKNGFFEEVYKGENFVFYIKHQKQIKKNTSRSKVFYFFVENKTFILKYKNHFYEIKNKRDIAKVVPHLKKEINDFFGHLRSVNAFSLTRLFSKLDKKA